jgi:hypothetical protein
MTKYIKTGTTEFEQFDETEWNRIYLDCSDPDEWEVKASKLGVDRYHGYFVISTKEGDMKIHDGDWIATGVNGEHWPVKDEIFKRTYKKLPLIPECVNYAIEWFEQNGDDLGQIFRNVYEDLADNWHESPQLKVAETWIISHPDEFAYAWLDGCEVAEASK